MMKVAASCVIVDVIKRTSFNFIDIIDVEMT